MVIGSGIIEMWIAESRSLKEKRGVLSRILKRTQNTFNISIAEIDDNDHWKRTKVGFCVVGNDARYINSKVDHVLRFIDDMKIAEVLDAKIEIIHLSDTMDSRRYKSGKYDEC
jgi:uncharacterized protein YlxP (DUF503 family)